MMKMLLEIIKQNKLNFDCLIFFVFQIFEFCQILDFLKTFKKIKIVIKLSFKQSKITKQISFSLFFPFFNYFYFWLRFLPHQVRCCGTQGQRRWLQGCRSRLRGKIKLKIN